MRIKIYGERNTGTNFLEDLVRANLESEIIPSNLPLSVKRVNRAARKLPFQNLDERIMDIFHMYAFKNRLGWKHKMLEPEGPTAGLNEKILFLLTIRDPYAWLSSMFKRPHNLCVQTENMTFAEFLRRPCVTHRRELVSFKEYSCPAEIWNLKAKAMMAFSENSKNMLFRHEDLVLKPEEEISRFSEMLDIPDNKSIEVREDSTKRDGRKRADIAKVILDREWLRKYSADDITYVNQWLDPDVVKFYGYEVTRS